VSKHGFEGMFELARHFHEAPHVQTPIKFVLGCAEHPTLLLEFARSPSAATLHTRREESQDNLLFPIESCTDAVLQEVGPNHIGVFVSQLQMLSPWRFAHSLKLARQASVGIGLFFRWRRSVIV